MIASRGREVWQARACRGTWRLELKRLREQGINLRYLVQPNPKGYLDYLFHGPRGTGRSRMDPHTSTGTAKTEVAILYAESNPNLGLGKKCEQFDVEVLLLEYF